MPNITFSVDWMAFFAVSSTDHRQGHRNLSFEVDVSIVFECILECYYFLWVEKRASGDFGSGAHSVRWNIRVVLVSDLEGGASDLPNDVFGFGEKRRFSLNILGHIRIIFEQAGRVNNNDEVSAVDFLFAYESSIRVVNLLVYLVRRDISVFWSWKPEGLECWSSDSAPDFGAGWGCLRELDEGPFTGPGRFVVWSVNVKRA